MEPGGLGWFEGVPAGYVLTRSWHSDKAFSECQPQPATVLALPFQATVDNQALTRSQVTAEIIAGLPFWHQIS